MVSDSDVSGALERSIKRKLGQVADMVDEHAYEAAVRAAGMKKGSEAALSQLGPRAGAALIVHLRLNGDSDLQVEVRSGKTGAVRSTLEFPLLAQGRRFKRPTRALRDLVASVQDGARAAPEPDEDAVVDAEPTASAPSSNVTENTSTSDEQVMDDPELREHLALSTPERDAGPRQGLGLHASVGFGPGSHVLSVPLANASQLDTGVAPAVELAAAAELGLGQWILRAEGQYRTFLGSAPAPIPSDITSVSGMSPTQTAEAPLTSHSFTIGASPGYRFGGRNSVALLLMLGWTYRSLQTSVATLPNGSLTGLVARPALYIPFGDGVFTLRFAPELILLQSSEAHAPVPGGITKTEATGGTGFGMEAALDVKLAKLLGAGLQYRRSRVVAANNTAVDEEWYVAVQAVLSL